MSRSDKSRIPVVYEDGELICFNKPSGMLVVPTPRGEDRTLVGLVNEQYRDRERLYPCHRLDRETSGVILFAKGRDNQERMMAAFQEREIQKRYIAFVDGRLAKPKGELKGYIRDLDQRRHGPRSQPKLALTRYEVVERRETFTVLAVYPITGRTNQIRIQFSQLGHPLLGDRKYGVGKRFSIKMRRTALHAQQLNFRHPRGGHWVTAEAPLAEDMRRWLGE